MKPSRWELCPGGGANNAVGRQPVALLEAFYARFKTVIEYAGDRPEWVPQQHPRKEALQALYIIPEEPRPITAGMAAALLWLSAYTRRGTNFVPSSSVTVLRVPALSADAVMGQKGANARLNNTPHIRPP